MKTQDGFVRQKDNLGASIQTNSEALEAYKKRRQKFNQIDIINNEVKEIKNDIKEIKQMMIQIISNK